MRYLMLGRMPPPIGGVTASVKNLSDSLDAVGEAVAFLGRRSIWRRYDIAHSHYSVPLKRAIGVVVGRLFARRSIFTVHGQHLDLSDRWNRLAVRFSNGIIVLNSQTLSVLRDAKLGIPLRMLPPIFAEGVVLPTVSDAEKQFVRDPGCRYLLLYAYGDKVIDGQEVYGVRFALDQLPYMPESWRIVLVDPGRAYEPEASHWGERVVYFGRSVDFPRLLGQSDVYLRPTTSDGSSVAVLESMIIGTPVVASDAVDRPSGVAVFPCGDRAGFINGIREVLDPSFESAKQLSLPSVFQYVEFCTELNVLRAPESKPLQ